MVIHFVFYVDSISVAATVAEIILDVVSFFHAETGRESGVGY